MSRRKLNTRQSQRENRRRARRQRVDRIDVGTYKRASWEPPAGHPAGDARVYDRQPESSNGAPAGIERRNLPSKAPRQPLETRQPGPEEYADRDPAEPSKAIPEVLQPRPPGPEELEPRHYLASHLRAVSELRDRAAQSGSKNAERAFIQVEQAILAMLNNPDVDPLPTSATEQISDATLAWLETLNPTAQSALSPNDFDALEDEIAKRLGVEHKEEPDTSPQRQISIPWQPAGYREEDRLHTVPDATEHQSDGESESSEASPEPA